MKKKLLFLQIIGQFCRKSEKTQEMEKKRGFYSELMYGRYTDFFLKKTNLYFKLLIKKEVEKINRFSFDFLSLLLSFKYYTTD